MADFALKLENVALSRGRQRLFTGLTLVVEPGELLWIHGDNGIGKSSLLRLMAGFGRADEGQIGWQKSGQKTEAKSIVAYQGHADAFKGNLTASEALRFWQVMTSNAGKDTAMALASAGLGHKTNALCRTLSAGQRRRLSLIRLTLSQRPLWLMDEPTAAMDEDGKDFVNHLVRNHVEDGGSAVIASHDAAQSITAKARRLVLKAQD